MMDVKSVLKDIPVFDNVAFDKVEIKALKGLSNKNFLLQYSDDKNNEVRCVLRIPQEETDSNVNRVNEKHNAALAYKLGFAPKILWQNEQGVSLTEHIDDTDAFSIQSFENLAAVIKKLHNCNESFKGSLLAEDIAKHFDHYLGLCTEHDKRALKPAHQNILDLCEKVKADEREPVPSHIDLVAENILIKDSKVWLIDWEYSAMASPFWDLASLSNNLKFNEKHSRDLLQICLSSESEKDYECLKSYQYLERKLALYWLKAKKGNVDSTPLSRTAL